MINQNPFIDPRHKALLKQAVLARAAAAEQKAGSRSYYSMLKSNLKKYTKLWLTIPAATLAITGVVVLQTYSQGQDSFMARAQEIYAQDLSNSGNNLWHTISKITEASGQTETIETWEDNTREAITVYDNNQQVVSKTVNIDKNTNNVKTYTSDNQGDLTNTAEQMTICFNNGSVDNNSVVTNLTKLTNEPIATTINRTEVLGDILKGTGVTDLGVAEGLHGFNITDATGNNIDYYLDEATLAFKKMIVHDKITGAVTSTRENTVSEKLSIDQNNNQVFDTIDLFVTPYTQFMETYSSTLGTNLTGCYNAAGEKIEAAKIENGMVSWGDDPSDATTTESVICPSANCINEK